MVSGGISEAFSRLAGRAGGLEADICCVRGRDGEQVIVCVYMGRGREKEWFGSVASFDFGCGVEECVGARQRG